MLCFELYVTWKSFQEFMLWKIADPGQQCFHTKIWDCSDQEFPGQEFLAMVDLISDEFLKYSIQEILFKFLGK